MSPTLSLGGSFIFFQFRKVRFRFAQATISAWGAERHLWETLAGFLFAAQLQLPKLNIVILWVQSLNYLVNINVWWSPNLIPELS